MTPHRAHIAVVAVAIAVSSAAIASTYGRLSQTADEPNHLATGLEWLERGRYDLHAENPPLARIAIALPAFARGWRLPAAGDAWRQGTELLYTGDYRRNLALVRVGVLPLFVASALLVFGLARRLASELAGVFATALYCATPAILGHAGLATTDLPLVTTLLLALYAMWRWLEQPSWSHAALLGVGVGLAVATKLSSLVFLPAAGAAVVPLWSLGRDRRDRVSVRWSRRAASLALAAVCAFSVTWSFYRFSFGVPLDQPGASRRLERCTRDGGVAAAALAWLAAARVPAPELVHGAIWLCAHDRDGHPAYLDGTVEPSGHRAFYAVALAVKTPLPVLVLGLVGLGWGAALTIRARDGRAAIPGAIALAVVAVASAGHINLGVRHVLPALAMLAISAGVVAAHAWHMQPVRVVRRGLLLALLGWQLGAVARSHPDELAYFNALAGDEPGELLVDSDLDWGQDLLALEAVFRAHAVDRAHVAYFGTARLCAHAMPALAWLPPRTPVTGWVAISEMYFRGVRTRHFKDACDPRSAYVVDRGDGQGYRWLEAHTPVARAGASICVYHITD
jgi:hypothetical protein